jgi:hypothetical protein
MAVVMALEEAWNRKGAQHRQLETAGAVHRHTLHGAEDAKELEKTGRVPPTYPYLVHVVQFGDDLTMIGLAGEVVVDYSLRLKKELAGAPVWVAGYTNDVFGYVPSRRVLEEGGRGSRRDPVLWHDRRRCHPWKSGSSARQS